MKEGIYVLNVGKYDKSAGLLLLISNCCFLRMIKSTMVTLSSATDALLKTHSVLVQICIESKIFVVKSGGLVC